jgi:hypothetical protein
LLHMQTIRVQLKGEVKTKWFKITPMGKDHQSIQWFTCMIVSCAQILTYVPKY